MKEADYLSMQLTLFDECECPRGGDNHDSLFGKTCRVLLAPTVEMTLEPCLKASQKPIFQCLKIINGQTQGWFNAMTVKLHGQSWTHSTWEFRNGEKESSLSQILQRPEDVPEKYYLSQRACQGILRRAKQREKILPKQLKLALEMQSGGGIYDVRISSDGTVNHRAHCYKTELCRSLDTHAPDPNTNHGGPAIIYDMTHADDVVRESKGKTFTLNARMGTGGNQIPILTENIPKEIMSTMGGQMCWTTSKASFMTNFTEDKAQTLVATDWKDAPVLVTENKQLEVCALTTDEDSMDRM